MNETPPSVVDFIFDRRAPLRTKVCSLQLLMDSGSTCGEYNKRVPSQIDLVSHGPCCQRALARFQVVVSGDEDHWNVAVAVDPVAPAPLNRSSPAFARRARRRPPRMWASLQPHRWTLGLTKRIRHSSQASALTAAGHDRRIHRRRRWRSVVCLRS
jgi:hypothetical protein